MHVTGIMREDLEPGFLCLEIRKTTLFQLRLIVRKDAMIASMATSDLDLRSIFYGNSDWPLSLPCANLTAPLQINCGSSRARKQLTYQPM
jgi:hypothetical protein